MITEQDLQAAIAECKGKKDPNANTCIMLAAFYIIKEHLYPERDVTQVNEPERYSFDPPPDNTTIELESDSEFAQVVNGRTVDEILPIVDEAMEALKVLNPRFYASIIRKIEY